MSAFPQPGYYPQPGYPAPALVPQQSTLTPEGQALAAQVAQGQFPFKNRWEVVGQVFSTNPQDPGFRWMNANNPQGEGHLEITVKIRRAWNGQRGAGVNQSKVKVIAYGALGQAIMQQIRTGSIIRAVGEGKVSNFQKRQGPQAGQWTTSVQVQLRQTQGGEVPFEVLGILPVVDEAPQRNNFGGGYPQQQGGYPQQGGYQQQGGYPAPAPQPGYAAPAPQPGYGAPAPAYAQPGGYPPAAAPAPQYAQPAQPQYAAPAPQPPYATPAPVAPAPAYAAPAHPQYAQPALAQPQPHPQYAQPAPQGVIPGTPPAQVAIPGQPQGTFMPPPPGAPMQGAPMGGPAPFPQPQ